MEEGSDNFWYMWITKHTTETNNSICNLTNKPSGKGVLVNYIRNNNEWSRPKTCAKPDFFFRTSYFFSSNELLPQQHWVAGIISQELSDGVLKWQLQGVVIESSYDYDTLAPRGRW